MFESRLLRLTKAWLIALLGAHVGASLAFTFEALRLDIDHEPYLNNFSDDLPLWLLATIVLVVASAAVTAVLDRRPRQAATYLLGGAFTSAVLPAEYRPLGTMTTWTLGVVLYLANGGPRRRAQS